MCSRSANSCGRLRLSSVRLNEATSHWVTLPFKCSIRLPMLLLASLGRHQTCSSVSALTHCRMRGQYWVSSLWREKLRKTVARSALVAVMGMGLIPRVRDARRRHENRASRRLGQDRSLVPGRFGIGLVVLGHADLFCQAEFGENPDS